MVPKVLGDQFKPNDAIQAKPTNVIHGRNIAGDPLTGRRVKPPILFVKELAERTRDVILLRLKAIGFSLVDDTIGFA
jgi:hypothetical protein